MLSYTPYCCIQKHIINVLLYYIFKYCTTTILDYVVAVTLQVLELCGLVFCRTACCKGWGATQRLSTSCSCCQIQTWQSQAPQRCHLHEKEWIILQSNCDNIILNPLFRRTTEGSIWNARAQMAHLHAKLVDHNLTCLRARSVDHLEAQIAQQSFYHCPSASGSVSWVSPSYPPA